VLAGLVDGDRVFQTVGAAIENDLSAKELMSGGRWRLMNAKSLLADSREENRVSSLDRRPECFAFN